ncbi:MAG: DMT family transporter [Patescibacteria group bacterium]|nr:DMT family transporter [Nitrososphaerota archaeon]MDE2591035.1 DMT family transporter [Patescibacteria group bacterium]
MTRLDAKSTKIGYAYAVLCAVLVGSISTASKPVLANTNPIMYGALIYLLAALSSVPLSYKVKGFQVKARDWPLVLAITVSGSILAPVLFFTGLEQTTASDTAVLSNSETIFTVLFALIFFKEKLGPRGYLAITLVLIGVFIVTTNLQFSGSLFDLRKEGNLLIILSMALWALDNNISKIAAQRIDISRLVQLKGIIGGGILFIFALALKIPIGITPFEVPNLLLVGMVGFGIALYLFLHSLRRIGTVKTMLIYSTGTVFGLFFAAVFLHENIREYQILAIALMLAGIYLITKESHNVEKLHQD